MTVQEPTRISDVQSPKAPVPVKPAPTAAPSQAETHPMRRSSMGTPSPVPPAPTRAGLRVSVPLAEKAGEYGNAMVAACQANRTTKAAQTSTSPRKTETKPTAARKQRRKGGAGTPRATEKGRKDEQDQVAEAQPPTRVASLVEAPGLRLFGSRRGVHGRPDGLDRRYYV